VKEGNLRAGDRLLEVNGINVDNISQQGTINSYFQKSAQKT